MFLCRFTDVTKSNHARNGDAKLPESPSLSGFSSDEESTPTISLSTPPPDEAKVRVPFTEAEKTRLEEVFKATLGFPSPQQIQDLQKELGGVKKTRITDWFINTRA